MEIFGAWLAVGLTLFMFSFLYKDNPFYKVGENLYVGITIGYFVIQLWYKTWIDKVWDVLKGEAHDRFLVLIPVVIGILLLTRFVPKISWMSRWAFAFVIGYGSGLAIPATLTTSVVIQAQATAKPLITMPDKSEAAAKATEGAKSNAEKVAAAPAPAGETTEAKAKREEGVRVARYKYLNARSQSEYSFLTAYKDFTTIVIFVGVFSVLFYFFFSIEHKGPVRVFSRIGILFLMIYFGASYGNTVMGRLSLLYGRILDLKDYSRPMYGCATPVILVLMIAVLAFLHVKNKGKEEEHAA
ncbi:MAG: hypothetical protein FD180_3855 [Planctomycetota bacterium]|nr:MAG: hypothetical protein FD180_3855 [Planctomycetota bacterium]